MKRLVALGVVGVLLLTAPGCGGPDALMREFVVNLNAYAETLEKNESRDKQAAALERIKATAEKMDKLKLSQEEKDKLFAKYEADFKQAKERVEAAQRARLLAGDTDTPDVFGGFKMK